MFDAKRLLDQLIGGANSNLPSSQAKAGQGDPLGDLLRDVPETGGGGGLGDILRQLGGDTSGGNLAEILSQVLGQATSGVREGAGQINQATGASDSISDAIRQLSGKNPDELIASIRELIANNQLGAGAALGGLGALILGTETGQSVAANAARIGAVALIGGLAYKAYQNYQNGRPLITGAQDADVEPPPAGSGFESASVTNAEATKLISAMVAASAADGHVDTVEQSAIMGSLQQAGLGPDAEEFIASQIRHPATVDELAASVTSKEEASRIYTAARIAVNSDSPAEKDFLSQLAARLDIEPQLAAHIDAAARSASA